MTKLDQKSVGKWMPFAPIAVGIVLTVCAILADHGSIASYNDARLPGAASLTAEFAVADEMSVQVSSLRK
jgi:hypothetical protein